MEGRDKAIAQGVKFGAKPKLSKQEIDTRSGILKHQIAAKRNLPSIIE